MKLLKLRVEFRENTRPIGEESALDKSILNQFRVPIRFAPKKAGQEGQVILLRGDANSNSETGEWHGTHGLVNRFLKMPVAIEGQQRKSVSGFSRVGRRTKLEVHEIDVN